MPRPKGRCFGINKMRIAFQVTGCLALYGTAAYGALLWDQPPTVAASPGFVSQTFPDMEQFDTYQYDDFSVQDQSYITRITVSGVEARRAGSAADQRSENAGTPQLWADLPDLVTQDRRAGGSALYNTAVIGEIWDGLPGSGEGAVVMRSVSGSEQLDTASLELDFGDQMLGAGRYWLTVYVRRPQSAGTQWFWLSTKHVQGSEHYFYNPGGGFGQGNNAVPASRLGSAGGEEKTDMVFSIEGRPVTESNHPQLIPEI
jgi:hypothetical protein